MVGAFVAGAVLSPGTDLVSMIMMTIPLLLLYEVGYAGAVVIHRRRRKAAADGRARARSRSGSAQAPARGAGPGPGAAAGAPAAGPDSLQDTTRRKPGQALDSATAGRLGIPTAPTRSFDRTTR